jgi:hypothetical protein
MIPASTDARWPNGPNGYKGSLSFEEWTVCEERLLSLDRVTAILFCLWDASSHGTGMTNRRAADVAFLAHESMASDLKALREALGLPGEGERRS